MPPYWLKLRSSLLETEPSVKLRLLVDRAVDRSLDADIEAIEFLPEAGGGAEAGVDRQRGEPRRQIRAVGIVGATTCTRPARSIRLSRVMSMRPSVVPLK